MANLEYEQEFYNQGKLAILGIDEAGRGPLAGPLVVAGVVLPPNYLNEDINDSKKLTEKKRETLFNIIKEIAVCYCIKIVPVEEIDDKNIYKATQEAMSEIAKTLDEKVDAILTDAMPLIDIDKPTKILIKGDAKSQNIAAASILAKVTRDHIMIEEDKNYPEYNFKKNKGYGTKDHLTALEKYGYTPIHRKSYEPIKSMVNPQLKLDI